MKKRLFALLLAMAMLLSLCACGGGTSSAEAPASAAETEAPAETAAPASAAPAPVEPAASAEESTVEPVVPASSVEYPIPGDHTFSMVGVMRMNAAEALNGGTYTETPPYDAMKEATGVARTIRMAGESRRWSHTQEQVAPASRAPKRIPAARPTATRSRVAPTVAQKAPEGSSSSRAARTEAG